MKNTEDIVNHELPLVSKELPLVSEEEINNILEQGLNDKFRNISEVYVDTLNTNLIDNTSNLSLYAFYQQATAGDATSGSQTDPEQEAWYNLHGMSKQEAKKQYIELYNDLILKQNIYITEQCYKTEFIADIVSDVKLDKDAPYWTSIVGDGYSFTPVTKIPFEQSLDYTEKVKNKYFRAGQGKIGLDLIAEKKPIPIQNEDFIKLFTETLFCKLVHSVNDIVDTKLKHYLKLFNINKINILLLI